MSRVRQAQVGDGARQLALVQRDLVAPGVGREVDVLQVPVVVRDADAGRAALLGQPRLEPAAQLVDRGCARAGRRRRARVVRRELRLECSERFRLLALRADAGEPEVARVARRFARAWASAAGIARSRAPNAAASAADSG